MNNEFDADLIILTNEKGENKEFKIIDKIEYDDSSFYILSPYYENPSEELGRAFEYYLFEANEKDGEEQLVELEDKIKADKIYEMFEEHYNEILFGE